MFTESELETFGAAKAILHSKTLTSDCFNSLSIARDYCQLALGHRECEIFMALFLNCRNQLIESVELFRGTLTTVSLYPREVVKEVLARNASGVIFAHNHPGGDAEPSQLDMRVTEKLAEALRLFDIRVLDHIVVSTSGTVSFAERGLL